MALRAEIVKAFHDALDRRESTLTRPLDDGTALLDSGLDSLGFAILVVLLEERLGFDPFSTREDMVFPSTFGEFVAVYETYARDQR